MEFSQYSFLDGSVVNTELIYLLGVEDAKAEQGIDHAIIFQRYQGAWHKLEINEKLISCTAWTLSDKKFLAVAENGMVTVLEGGMVISECIALGEHSPSANGPLIEVRAVANGHAYAVGTARQAYRKEGEDNWVRLDQTCKPSSGEKRAEVCFHSIDGFAKNDIYAVGWNGEIWHYDGQSWEQKTSPTNLSLFKVRCCGDGYVYACGQLGTIIKGRDDTWEVLEQEETEESLRGLAYFKGEVYISSVHFVYKISEKGLKQIDIYHNPISCLELDAIDDLMISVGAKDVFLFDGITWTKLI